MGWIVIVQQFSTENILDGPIGGRFYGGSKNLSEAIQITNKKKICMRIKYDYLIDSNHDYLENTTTIQSPI